MLTARALTLVRHYGEVIALVRATRPDDGRQRVEAARVDAVEVLTDLGAEAYLLGFDALSTYVHEVARDIYLGVLGADDVAKVAELLAGESAAAPRTEERAS